MGALALALGAAACGGGSGDDALAGDDALGRDLALAGQDSTQPALQDVPAAETPAPAPVVETPAPAPAPARPSTPRPRPRPTPSPAQPAPTPAPAPAPAPAAPTEGAIASGTTLRFATNTQVCTGATNVGDKFTARLSSAVEGANGATIPAGATGTFEVVTAKRAQNQNDETFLTVRLVSVTVDGNVYPVVATTESAATTKVRAASKGTDAKKVAGGAILGAIAGQILGKDTKSTVVGAAAGAAAGTAAAVGTADFDTCLNGGSAITVTLSSPVTVKIAG
jgi:outer membrane biosynthesis protein TonB